MHQRATVTMSMRELDRLKCIQAVIEGGQSAKAAAESRRARHTSGSPNRLSRSELLAR